MYKDSHILHKLSTLHFLLEDMLSLTREEAEESTFYVLNYSIKLVTTPVPTVLLPSRNVNLVPISIGSGCMRDILNLASSPGMTKDTPSGSLMAAATSAVLT